jgi:mannose-6-phosphate isomerase-like protein (cupin superfamily)
MILDMEPGVSFSALDPDSEERFVPLRRLLGVTSFGLNQILLRPGQRGRIHRHEHQEEVYLVLAGTLTLIVEGETRELGQGELARIAPDLRRQLINRRPGEDLLLLALGGAGEHVGRDGEAFTDWDQETGAPPQEVPLPDDEPL